MYIMKENKIIFLLVTSVLEKERNGCYQPLISIKDQVLLKRQVKSSSSLPLTFKKTLT